MNVEEQEKRLLDYKWHERRYSKDTCYILSTQGTEEPSIVEASFVINCVKISVAAVISITSGMILNSIAVELSYIVHMILISMMVAIVYLSINAMLKEYTFINFLFPAIKKAYEGISKRNIL